MKFILISNRDEHHILRRKLANDTSTKDEKQFVNDTTSKKKLVNDISKHQTKNR